LVLWAVSSSTNCFFNSLFCLFKVAVQASGHRFSSGRSVERGDEGVCAGVSLFALALPPVAVFSPVFNVDDLPVRSLLTVSSEMTGIPTLPAYQSSISAVLGWWQPCSHRGCSHCLQLHWWSGSLLHHILS
jgi:hypothetical protein